MLTVAGVTKSYGDLYALDAVSLQLPLSSYAVIVGESGSGKSTLLRAIAGLIPIDAGSIALGDRAITRDPAHRRPVTSVFQNYALFPHQTVAQNIAFGLEQRRVATADIRSRTGDMLDLVGLSGYEHRRPAELSGGQQQRVALARALAVQPRAVMLDEPLGALDPEMRAIMRRELARIQRESGVLFLHVSHDREEAWTLADHLVVMHAGANARAGAIDDLRANPADLRTARILGFDNAMHDPVQPQRHFVFAPEHVQPGGGPWRGEIVEQRVIGAWRESDIRLPDGTMIRWRAVADDARPMHGAIRFSVPEFALRVVE